MSMSLVSTTVVKVRPLFWMMRKKFSEEFGEVFTRILEDRNLSVQQASIATQGRISASYIHHFKHGRIPSYDYMLVLRDAFGQDQVAPLFALAGYEAEPPALPPGAMRLDGAAAVPLGPRVSAHDLDGVAPDHRTETVDLSQAMGIRDGDYALTVHGDCLEPKLSRGDVVLVRPTSSAKTGTIVVARSHPDYDDGSLTDGWTMKVWRSGKNAGYYDAKGRKVLEPSDARIVGSVIRALTSPRY